MRWQLTLERLQQVKEGVWHPFFLKEGDCCCLCLASKAAAFRQVNSGANSQDLPGSWLFCQIYTIVLMCLGLQSPGAASPAVKGYFQASEWTVADLILPVYSRTPVPFSATHMFLILVCLFFHNCCLKKINKILFYHVLVLFLQQSLKVPQN